MRYFVALAETLDTAKAAKHCGLSPSALNRHITELEESLGCSLFRAHGRKTLITAAGQVFFQRAKDLLFSAAIAAGEVRMLAAGAASSAKIGFSTEALLQIYKTELQRFAYEFGGLSIDTCIADIETLLNQLRTKMLDFVVLEYVDVGLRIDFNVRLLRMRPCQVILPRVHPLSKRKRLSLQDLSKGPWLLWAPALSPSHTQAILEAAREAKLVPCLSQEFGALEKMYEGVEKGEGFGLLPQGDEIGMPSTLVSLALPTTELCFPVFSAWRKDAEQLGFLAALANRFAKVKSRAPEQKGEVGQ